MHTLITSRQDIKRISRSGRIVKRHNDCDCTALIVADRTSYAGIAPGCKCNTPLCKIAVIKGKVGLNHTARPAYCRALLPKHIQIDTATRISERIDTRRIVKVCWEFDIEELRHRCNGRLDRNTTCTLDVESAKPPKQRIICINTPRKHRERLRGKEAMQLKFCICKTSCGNRLHDRRLMVKASRGFDRDCQVHLVHAYIIGLCRSVTFDRKRRITVIANRECNICRGIAQHRSICQRDFIEISNIECLRFDQQPFEAFACLFHGANTFLDVTNSTVFADQSLNAKF
nr:MAG TPA: hypothetical protein [Bacteriophage sp.]